MGSFTMDPITGFSQAFGPITPTASYATATDTDIDVRGMNDKVIMVKNNGANSLTFTILGSIDDGDEYDITHLGDTAVGAGLDNVQRFDTYFTNLRIRVKAAAATTATIKVAATGN